MKDTIVPGRLHQEVIKVAKLAALFMGLFIIFLQPLPANAHSTLLEMEPAEKVVSQDTPETLLLRFNEPIEHDLAVVTIYDWNAKPVFTGNPDDNVEKSPKLTFSLPTLDEGTYTVKWDVISADGHPVDGSYAFSIGVATEGGVKTVDKNGGAEGALTLVRIIPESLILLGAGLFWFGWLAERRQFPSLDSLWRRGRRTGAIFIVLGTVAELITYGLYLPPGIIQVILNGRWELLLQFPFVLMLFAQIFFLGLLFIPGMVRGWYLTIWLLLAATLAFGGHVWSMQDTFIAFIPRIFHQVSIAFWLGALSYVILLLIFQKKQNATVPWKEFRPFFVGKMMIASGLVVVSGVVMIILQTGVTAIFADWKTWSAIVIIKIILTIVMGSLALFQTLKWKKKQTFTTGSWIRTEWLVGLVIIVLGVWLSQIPYPFAVKTYEETLAAEHVEADIYIDQLKMGDRKMTANISDLDGEKPENVQVKVSMPQHDMGSDKLTADKNDNGNYTVMLPFSMSGTWLLEITATYPDGEKIDWEDEIFIAGQGN